MLLHQLLQFPLGNPFRENRIWLEHNRLYRRFGDDVLVLTREHGVATIPVSVFYPAAVDNRVVRFCFAKSDETLAAAGRRLREL